MRAYARAPLGNTLGNIGNTDSQRRRGDRRSAGLLLGNGVLNPAVALTLGLVRSPALWGAALDGVAFAALFDLLSVKQGQEGQEGRERHEEEAAQQPAQAPAPQPAVPAYHLGTPVVSAAPTARVTGPLARPTTPRLAKTQPPTPARSSLWSSVTDLFGRKVKQQAHREPDTRPASGDWQEESNTVEDDERFIKVRALPKVRAPPFEGSQRARSQRADPGQRRRGHAGQLYINWHPPSGVRLPQDLCGHTRT
ncbi:MAG TPA: hypothetical protein VIL85_22250 [Thermomicrobiales bacterium]